MALAIGLTAAESPIADAASRGDREAVMALLKKAADVNAAQGDGMTALHWAAMNGDSELAQMLIVAGANVRATTRLGTYTPLYLASQQGHAAVIQALVKAGADVKAGTPNGTTPLMAAAGNGYSRGTGTEAFIRDRRDFSSYNGDPLEIATKIPVEEERAALEAVK
ncbi:MAG: ankyrin repeat domain-containing protein, partial [Vicinamibacterales bacterium]